LPHRKRLSHVYGTSEEGAKELTLFYGVHEVTFDEEHLMPFAEELLKQSSFIAQSATSWGPGYRWDELSPLFATLLELGVVKREGEDEDTRGCGLVPPLLPPAECKVLRTWSAADCEALTLELGGRAVEIGYIEAFVFTFRLAHSAVDEDGRQIGEANVYPTRLRVDQETEWRVCQYSGSRYRDAAPMNVTALKAMIKHWKPMMLTMLEARAYLKARLPRSQGSWTVGDLHTFVNVVLTLPAYLLLKGGGQVPQPPLHQVLSSLFRITDGIRMTTHEMLFLTSERGRSPSDVVSAEQLYDFAERYGLLMTDTGVCAGPKTLIDEFLVTVCDGVPVEGGAELVLPAQVQGLLDELPKAVDYGLYALQVWTVVRSVWMAMSLAYERFRALVEGASSEVCVRLRERFDSDREILERALVASEEDRAVQHRAHVDAYEQAWRALRQPVGPATLEERIAPAAERPAHRQAAGKLREILGQRFFASGLGDEVLDEIAALLMRYLRQEQSILAGVGELEDAINPLLERPAPTRPLTVRDCRLAYVLRQDHLSEFPYLFDTLSSILGIGVECTVELIEITDERAAEAA
jgi:hypothetical protein